MREHNRTFVTLSAKLFMNGGLLRTASCAVCFHFVSKEKKKIVLRSEKNLDFLLFKSWMLKWQVAPNLWGTGNCTECIFSFYLEHNEALSNNGRSKCFLIGIEGRNSKKATERGVENRTKVASCQNPNIVAECVLVLSVSHLGGAVLKWLSWIKNRTTVYK